MIAVELKSRLGNQMFELAAAHHLAKELHKELALIENGSNDYVKYPIITDNRNIITSTARFHVLQEKDNQAWIDLSQAKDHENVLLKGYFQSDKYFTREEAEELFQIPTDIKEKYGYLQDKVCLSVRRGDYLKFSSYFISPSPEWFEKCYHKHFEGKDVVIASDDIKWCKQHFNLPNQEFIEADPINTLFIKACCKNHIISPSTFAWWSAYLADAKTVAPSDWVGKGLKAKNFNEKDKYVEGWIKEDL